MKDIELIEVALRDSPLIEAIEKKNEKRPYFHMERFLEHGERRHYASFGIRLVSIVDHSFMESHLPDLILLEQVRFIQRLLAAGSGQSAELRYIARPDSDNWTQGKLDVALIFKSFSELEESALQNSEQLWRETRPNLSLMAGSFEFSPICSAEEFSSHYEPFEIHHIAEITRREEALPFGSRESIYIPSPFIHTYSNMGRLCKGLLVERHPVLYSVTIKPAALSSREKDYFDNPFVKSGLSKLSKIGFAKNSEEMGNHSIKAHGASKDFYLQKIFVASSHEISRSLLDLIGCEITLPSAPREIGKNILDQIHVGGYVWQKAEADVERQLAVMNLRCHDFSPWVRSIAPAGLPRLRDLVDPVQAGSSTFSSPIFKKNARKNIWGRSFFRMSETGFI